MDLLDKANERTQKAEVYTIDSKSIPVEFEAGELASVKSVATKGRSLRIINDGKLGYSTSTNMKDDKRIIERALESAQLGENVEFDFPHKTELQTVNTFDKGVSELSAEEMIGVGKDIVGKLQQFNSSLQINVMVTKSSAEIKLANTGGLNYSETRTNYSINVEIQRVGEEDIFTLWDGVSSRKKSKVNPETITSRLLRQLRWAEETVEINSGKQPVLFTPRGALVLLFPLIAGLNGKNAYLETSPVSDRLGEKLFSSRFSLIDDGTDPDSARVQSFDDEGWPTSKKYLIKAGRLENFFYDVKTASKANETPTGNGFKGGILSDGDFRSNVSPSPSSLKVEPGDRTFGELIKEIDEGIMVDQVLGLGQGNVLSGEFSNNVAVAYKIENGTIKGRIKNTMIAGNAYNLFENELLGLGKTNEWIGGVLNLPPIAMKSLNVVQERTGD